MPSGALSEINLSKRITSPGIPIMETITTSTIWKCPPGVEKVKAVIVAGGGGGGGIIWPGYNSNYENGGGGGGGQVLIVDIPVTPGENYNLVIGNGGAGNPAILTQPGCGSNGGDSYFAYTTATSSTSAILAISMGGGRGGGFSRVIPGGLGPGLTIYVRNQREYDGGDGGNGGVGAGVGYFGGGTRGNPRNVGYSAQILGSAFGGGGAGSTGKYNYYEGGGGDPLIYYPITPSGRLVQGLSATIAPGVSALYLSPGGGSGAGYREMFWRNYGGGTPSYGTALGGNGSYWTFGASVYIYNAPTAGKINTGAGGGGGGTTKTATNSPGANGGSGVIYLIYDRIPSKI